jgi:hypothetical protein
MADPPTPKAEVSIAPAVALESYAFSRLDSPVRCVSKPAIRASAQLQLSNGRGKVIRRDLAQQVNRIRSQVFWRCIESKIRLPKDFVTRPPAPLPTNTCKVCVIQTCCWKTMI